jgi:hypothetical protein
VPLRPLCSQHSSGAWSLGELMGGVIGDLIFGDGCPPPQPDAAEAAAWSAAGG